MFKKTLVAVAALAAFGSAYAADVQLYGVVDYGFLNTTAKTKVTQNGVSGTERAHANEMKTGLNAGPRFGLKGSEDLGNGYKVGFKLENQFNADDGTFKSDHFFHREAALTLYTPYGSLALGRMGGVGSSAGTYDLVYLYADAFDGFDNNIGGLVVMLSTAVTTTFSVCGPPIVMTTW